MIENLFVVVCHKFWKNLYTSLLSFQNSSFQALLPFVRQLIIDGFTPKARDLFQREFDFFDKVTSISGVLYPVPKEERRAGIRRYASSMWITELIVLHLAVEIDNLLQ